MAPECNRVSKRLAEKIADKCREPYASVITYVRTKLRFSLLKSTLDPCYNTKISRQAK